MFAFGKRKKTTPRSCGAPLLQRSLSSTVAPVRKELPCRCSMSTSCTFGDGCSLPGAESNSGIASAALLLIGMLPGKIIEMSDVAAHTVRTKHAVSHLTHQLGKTNTPTPPTDPTARPGEIKPGGPAY